MGLLNKMLDKVPSSYTIFFMQAKMLYLTEKFRSVTINIFNIKKII